jgi:hypothetical protein
LKATVKRLEALLEETGRRHHASFIETDGDDPGWANWYAAYVVDRLPSIIDSDLPESELAALFERLAEQQASEAPGTSWARFYAEYLVEEYSR